MLLGKFAAQQSVHPTLGILRKSQAFFYALAFFQLDGFAVPRPSAGNANRWALRRCSSCYVPDYRRCLKMPQWGLSFSEVVLWNITRTGDRGMTFILPAFVTSITPPPIVGAFAPALRYMFAPAFGVSG